MLRDTTPTSGSTTQAMQGVALVSWRADHGRWHDALLGGANRLKSRDGS